MSRVQKIESHPLTKVLKKMDSKIDLTEDERHFVDFERMQWDDFDDDVKKGARSFVQVGRALKEIKERKLYKFEGKTFEEYLKDRLGMSRSQGYRLMDTGSLAFEMEVHVSEWKPTYESHVRPLVDLNVQPKKAAEIMVKAMEKAKKDNTPMSAKLVKQVARAEVPEVFKDATAPKPKIKRIKKSDFKEQMANLLSENKTKEAIELLGRF